MPGLERGALESIERLLRQDALVGDRWHGEIRERTRHRHGGGIAPSGNDIDGEFGTGGAVSLQLRGVNYFCR